MIREKALRHTESQNEIIEYNMISNDEQEISVAVKIYQNERNKQHEVLKEMHNELNQHKLLSVSNHKFINKSTEVLSQKIANYEERLEKLEIELHFKLTLGPHWELA